MRMLPSRYAAGAKPVKVKQRAADLGHISAPLKGLSLSSKLAVGDPLKAPILDNWVLEEDRIRCRPGSKLIYAESGAKPVESLVPYYGAPSSVLALATDGKLVNWGGVLVKSGFTGNDWSWTSFSNLGVKSYTIMVNGKDGVWSWGGGTGTDCVKEAVTAPTTATWVDPNKLNIVITHMNRLWFADEQNLAVYYLPVQQKSGALLLFPLNAIFKRGGVIRAMFTWSIDGGAGQDDKLVIFTSNGECAVYTGVDPATDFQLVGVYRFDSPMSKHCVVNYGGELHVLISTGLVPLSTMLKAESDRLGESDKDVLTAFTESADRARAAPGWDVVLHPGMGRMICNMPQGALNRYKQMIKKMPSSYWTSWSRLPARCWCWINEAMYFGSDDGKLYRMSKSYLSDNGVAITVDVQSAWSNFKTPAVKQFKMLRPYIISDGVPRAYIDIRVDYDTSPPTNQPDVTFTSIGTEWDVGTWDVDDWAAGAVMQSNWSGVAGFGTVGAARLTASILNCEFSISGFDCLYETGSVMG